SYSLTPCLATHRLLFSNYPPPTEIYTLSLHDALPISQVTEHEVVERVVRPGREGDLGERFARRVLAVEVRGVREHLHAPHVRRRSEEHTSELQSLTNLVCRLLLEKKKDIRHTRNSVIT